MEHDPAPSEPVVVEGLLFREYFVGRFSIGGNGLAVIHGSPPPPRARMTFSAQKLNVEISEPLILSATLARRLIGTIKGALAPWTGGSWSYHEFEQAQIFETPHWATAWGLSLDEYPVGVRLHLGESRAALLFFTTRVEAVLEALERHRVRVEQSPIKLSPWLIGRR